MISKNKIQSSISELVELITRDFINEEGLVSSVYPPSKSNLISDLDDIFPFLLYLDIDKSFLKSQILRSRRYTYNGLALTNGRVVSYRNDEYLGALFAYYQKYKEEWVYKLILDSLHGIKELLVRDKVLCTFHDISTGSTPLISSPRTGALVEVLIENRNLIPDNLQLEFDEIVKSSLEAWLKCKFFQEYNLFPSKLFLKNEFKNRVFRKINIPLPTKIRKQAGSTLRCTTWWKKPMANLLYEMPFGEKVQCMKQNTNLGFSLIEAYKTYKDKGYKEYIEKWIRGLKGNLYKDGFIYEFWNSPKNIKEIELSQNFSVIDILCDTYKFVSGDNDHLRLAEEIAESWIDQAWNIGLIPRTPQGNCNHLDDQTDFSISLVRLHELTQKEKYREVATCILEGILKFHKREKGYILSVDRNGNPVDETISPKFNSLFLKALIFFDGEEKIYESEYIHNLLKDR